MNSIKHVAIIMDGNGRWGVKHKKSRNLGHKEGLKTVEKVIKATIKNKILYRRGGSYERIGNYKKAVFLKST